MAVKVHLLLHQVTAAAPGAAPVARPLALVRCLRAPHTAVSPAMASCARVRRGQTTQGGSFDKLLNFVCYPLVDRCGSSQGIARFGLEGPKQTPASLTLSRTVIHSDELRRTIRGQHSAVKQLKGSLSCWESI